MSQTSTMTDGEMDNNAYLTIFNNIYSANSNVKIKLYDCQFYLNDTLIASYVPNGNGVYDNVSEVSITGNGTFIQGPQLTRRVKRGYVGVGNQTRIFYRTGTYFSSSIVPTSWGTVSVISNFSASNNYGTWNIYSSTNASSTSYPLSKAFDTSSSSFFRKSGTTAEMLEIILTAPEGIRIKPEKFTARVRYSSDLRVYGSNDGSTYKEIGIDGGIYDGASDVTWYPNTNNHTYYRYFKFKLMLGSGSSVGYVYDFKIPSGWVDKD